MELTYEEALKYSIYDAIEILGKDRREFKTPQEWLHSNDDNPAKVKNNPLLVDFDYVYENAEKILYNDTLNYQQNQSFEAYLTLFKALTKKYSFEDDYNAYLIGDSSVQFQIRLKWSIYFHKMLNFISYAFDERVGKMLNHQEVIDYLLKYQVFFNSEELSSSFSSEGMNILLNYNHIRATYIDDYNKLVQLIRRYMRIKVPTDLMLNKKVIKDMSHNHLLEEFYFDLYFVKEQICHLPYLEEHKKYCDKQVEKIKDGILPCYYDKYLSSKKQVFYENVDYSFNSNEAQVAHRIFERSGKNVLPKKYFYQELSKYMIVGMFISRNYQTDPYNLYIDLETLYEFSTKHNKQLQASLVYELLIKFEDKDINEIVNLYNQSKELPLMEMLYDDWNNIKYDFIDELNNSIFKVKNLEHKNNQKGFNYIDINDIEEPILVHNTGIRIEDLERINKMIEGIKSGKMDTICLSLQDKNHKEFYIKDGNENKTTIKFVYGPLEKEKVGIINHEDAYSTGIDSVESENFEYKRIHYTVEEFMNMTKRFNEIVYVIGGEPFMPIGVICEDKISDEEKYVADSLGIPILYRDYKKIELDYQNDEKIEKHYTYTMDKRMF